MRCVDTRSHAYLDIENPEAAPAWYKGKTPAADEVIFTWVLADCAPHMEDAGWRNPSSDRWERMIGDAYRHFWSVGASIKGAHDATIT